MKDKEDGFMKRVAILLSILVMVAPCSVLGQGSASTGQDANKKRAGAVTQTAMADDQPAKVSVKIAEGERVILRNRFGPIIVTGVGGETLEAAATVTRQGTSKIKLHLLATRPAQEKVMIATAVSIPGQAQGKGEGKGISSTSSSTSSSRAGSGQQPPMQAQQTAPAQPQQPPQPRPGAQGGRTERTPRAPRAPRPPRAEGTPAPDTIRGVGEIRLEVKLPQNARIELIDSRRYAVITSGTPNYLTNSRNDVTITNVETPVSIISSGDVQASNVAGIEARTRAGNVTVRNIEGPVSITTVTGAIVVRDAGADVRAVSISGAISIECARGRIDATTANGIITLAGIGGDLEAVTTGGSISFTGAIRDGGRYRLKSMSGPVRMFIQKEPPGFQASVSSYKGQIAVDFPLKLELSANTATSDLPSTQGQPVRRMTGRYGDADARITLDSFSGMVQLARTPSEGLKKCR